jgi:hypothetical protein
MNMLFYNKMLEAYVEHLENFILEQTAEEKN